MELSLSKMSLFAFSLYGGYLLQHPIVYHGALTISSPVCNKVGLDKEMTSCVFLFFIMLLGGQLLFDCYLFVTFSSSWVTTPRIVCLFIFSLYTKPHLCVIRPFDFVPKFSPLFPKKASLLFVTKTSGFIGLLSCDAEKMWSVTKLPQPRRTPCSTAEEPGGPGLLGV